VIQHHGLKEARKAAKKVKTIEIQKLIKKIKKHRFGNFHLLPSCSMCISAILSGKKEKRA